MILLHLKCKHTVLSDIEPNLQGRHFILCPKCETAKEQGANIPLAWIELTSMEETSGDVPELLSRFPFIMPEDIMRLRPEGTRVNLRPFPYKRGPI